ncbi:uncharacterized protein LOC131323734 [Rhododendron vialii]|uniref:uncharacterized protein LOC131323734 n=1 Tax=Rhododendron vialii TaxID=182163 RepID=UPI00265F8F6B|nr:uncharacterized protein LOC131323734 [Rhododendron vialii]
MTEQEFNQQHKEFLQASLESPMPWIGMYIAAASLVCSVAMAGDVIHGIRRKKLWFPSKYFTMNAASLTVLAVAMKLPVDLTTAMWGRKYSLAKLSSNVFMITVMGNFLISFASMKNNEIFMNIVAFGILLITIIVNNCIQMHTWGDVTDDDVFKTHIKFDIISMLVLFVTLNSLVLTIPTAKRYIELKYNELHETTCEVGKLEEIGKLTHQKLKEVVEKYWVMAETGSPQFVMALSVVTATSGPICLASALSLIRADILSKRDAYFYNIDGGIGSSYGWSISFILIIQYIGVVVGTIAPVCRWFIATSINCNNLFTNTHHKEFKLVETYWIQRLVDWKAAPLPFPIRSVKCKKVIGSAKILVLNVCIAVQVGIVVASKLVQLISIIITLPLFSCFYFCKRMKEDPESNASTNNRSLYPENTSPKLDLYVLQLEGEAKLPKIIMKNMCHELNQVIQMGKSKQPKNLTELLQKTNNNFKGVADFDKTNQVPKSWTMSVVNLTSIAIALPNIESYTVDRLISSVSEGLLYAGLVEESFSSKGDNRRNLKCVADLVWAGVELNRKWLDKDLRKLPLAGKTIEGTLQALIDITEKATFEFQRSVTERSKVLATNSMHKISQTILNDYKSNMDARTDGHLFEQLSIMIADILGASLSNLPRVVVKKCYHGAIEEREKSIKLAAHLLGETEEILEIIKHHQLPSLCGDRAAYIDEWHAYMMQKNPPAIIPSLNNEIVASSSGELHINVVE